jgi:hypothetical protein
MPVNLGVKVVHGQSLRKGLQFYDSFLATYWHMYLQHNATYGLNEQASMMDVVKVRLRSFTCAASPVRCICTRISRGIRTSLRSVYLEQESHQHVSITPFQSNEWWLPLPLPHVKAFR